MSAEFPTDVEREALRKRHGCAPVADENTTLGRLVYFCNRHHVGWLTDVNACAHVDAALDALAPLIRAREAAAWDAGAKAAWERSTPEVNGLHYWWRTSGEPLNPYRQEADDARD